MSDVQAEGSTRSFGRVIEVIATISMVFATIGVVAPLVGGNGLRITGRPDGSEAMMSVTTEPSSAFNIDLGNPLPTMVDDLGEVSVFGQAVVEVGDPLTATAYMLDPTSLQRVVWLLWQVSGPLLALLIAWPLLQMARSTRAGNPFTVENERRLWRISGLVIGGGFVAGLIAGVAQTIIVQRSAAADLFNIELTIDFIPIIVGLVIAALASIWHQGVAMHDELDATI